jgi:rhamnopyranosyl-N-acetylglucosaminyl-diphospho-decaprenol beta-1,3/1,4-galactofuranosyltransferase
VTVCAVVVTYNRKALVVECLDAVLVQSHPVAEVIVLDNGSTDGTGALLRARGYLHRPDVHHVELSENRGGAGGFAEGLRLARERTADWIWVMDDDAEPRPDAVERLLASPPAALDDTVALCPKVVYATGGIDSNQRGHFHRRLRPLSPSEYREGHYAELGFLSFVGSLLRASAVRKIDLPRADFFVWGDDVEYSIRLRAQGRLRLVPESVVVHKRSSQAYSNRRSRFWNGLLPVTLHPTPLERFWQNLCGLRNYIWMKRVYEGQSPISAAGTAMQFVVKALLVDEQPLRRIPWILRYALRGRRGDFANISPSRWVEMVKRGEV